MRGFVGNVVAGMASQSRWVAAVVLAAFMLTLTPSPAQATVTYTVPENGLSFDANNTIPGNACTEGFGNEEADPENPDDPHPDLENDEVNLLKTGDSLRYNNVVTIGGQVIDANVTLTSISGTQEVGDEPRLRFLDTCEENDQAARLKTRMRSVTTSPGEASAVLTIDFLLGGTTTTATLTNLKMNVEDIDTNEYVEVDNFTSTRLAADRSPANIQEYQNGDLISVGVLPDPVVVSSPSARRFHATGESFGDDPPNDEKHVVEVSYPPVSSIVVRLGVYQDRSPAINLSFRGFAFESPTEEFSSGEPPIPSSSGSNSSSSADGAKESIQPAIHLDLKARAGDPVAGAPVLIEGQGLSPGSAYSLVVRSAPTTVTAGTASSAGSFSALVGLPSGISPGTHSLTLTATGAEGSTLSLETVFVVSGAGTFSSIGPGLGTVVSALAATGPNSFTLLIGVVSSFALLLLGFVALLLSGKRGARIF